MKDKEKMRLNKFKEKIFKDIFSGQSAPSKH